MAINAVRLLEQRGFQNKAGKKPEGRGGGGAGGGRGAGTEVRQETD